MSALLSPGYNPEFLASQPCFNMGPQSVAFRLSAAHVGSADPDHWVPHGTGPLSQNSSHTRSAEFCWHKPNFPWFSVLLVAKPSP